MDNENNVYVIIIIAIMTILLLVVFAFESNKSDMSNCLDKCAKHNDINKMNICLKSCELLRSEFNITSNQNNTYIHGYFTKDFINEMVK